MDAPPRTRRSRTGCYTCRRRKVRCDERTPVCRSCDRLALECSFQKPVDSSNGIDRHKTSGSKRPKWKFRYMNSNAAGRGRTESDCSDRGMVDTPSSSRNGDNVQRASESQITQFQDHTSLDTEHWSQNGSSTGLLDGNNPQSMPADVSLILDSIENGNVNEYLPQTGQLWPSVSCDNNQPSIFGNESQMTSWGLEDGTDGLRDVLDFVGSMHMDFDACDFETTLPGMPEYFPQLNNSSNLLAGTDTNRIPSPATTPPTNPRSRSSGTNPVVIGPGDNELIQHYLNTMSQFSKLRTSEHDNIYCTIFSNLGLFHAGLFNAMMAWAALHFAYTRGNDSTDAEVRYERATNMLYSDGDRADGAEPIDVTLATIWFMLQYELLLAARVDRFSRLLSYAADVLRAHYQPETTESSIAMSALGTRLLTWIIANDERACYFGNAGKLLNCAENYLPTQLGTSTIPLSATTSTIKHTPWFIVSNSNNPSDPPSDAEICYRIQFQLKIIAGRCILLGRWRGGGDHCNDWMSLRASLLQIRPLVEDDEPARFAYDIATNNNAGGDGPASLTALQYNRLQVLVSYYSAVISYHQHIPSTLAASPAFAGDTHCYLISRAMAAGRMVRMQFAVQHARPDSPQGLWPMFLFLTGLETRDPLYRAWIIQTLSNATRWGPNFGRIRTLLEAVLHRKDELRRQGKDETQVDFVDVMGETTGFFII